MSRSVTTVHPFQQAWNTSIPTGSGGCVASSSNPPNSEWSGSFGPSGSKIIFNLTATTTFTLECGGRDFNPTYAQVTVTLTPGSPPLVSLIAYPTTTQSRQAGCLAWCSPNP